MFRWLAPIVKPDSDNTEERLLNLFDFMLRDFGFSYAREELGNALDKDGNFIFYGPLNAYQFYNEKLCISILHLVQRDDYNVFITDKKSDDQVYIINGVEVPSRLAYDLPLFANELKESFLNGGDLYGYRI